MAVLSAPLRRFSSLDIASRAAALSFGTNGALMVMKIALGLAFGSVAVLGDGVDSAQDVLASAVAFFTVRLALQPADETHPYGHGKAESLAALSQAALIAGGGAFIIVAAGYRLAGDDVEIVVGPSLAGIGIAAAANLAVAAYAMRAAKVSGSVAIESDARHLMSYVVQAGAVAAALLLVDITGNHIFDPIVALLLAAYLLWVALGILRGALSELIDSSLPDEEIARVEECLRHEGHGVRGYHALRTRKSGREKYIEVHLLIDPGLSVSEAHKLLEGVEGHLRELIPGAEVSIHLDPDEPGIMDRSTDDAAPAPADLRLHRH
jgi:cation diffusion facilitator family transporter